MHPIDPPSAPRSPAHAPEQGTAHGDAPRTLVPMPGPAPAGPGQVVTPPPVLSASPTPWALLHALRRRWFLALLAGVLLGVPGAAVMGYLAQPSWKARTKLRVESKQPFIVSETPEVRTDFANYQRSQVALIKSRLVLNRTLRDPEVAKLAVIAERADPVEWLERQVQVDFSEAPEVLSISMNGDHPDDMSVLVNAVRAAYLKEIVNREYNIRLARLDQLQKLYAKLDEVLQGKREKLREMAETLGARDSKILAVKHQAAYNRLNRVENDYFRNQAQLREAQVDLAKLTTKYKTLADTPVPAQAVEDALKQHPRLVQLAEEIAHREETLARLKRSFKRPDSEPTVKQHTASLAAARKTLEEQREALRPAVTKILREESVATTRAAAEAQKEKIGKLADLEKLLSEEYRKRVQEIQEIGKGTVGLEGMKDEITTAEELARKVGAQAHALQIELEAPSRISLLEEATATQTRDRKSQVRTAAMAGMGLFALGLLGISFWEFRARKVTGVEDVVQGLGLRLVGALPLIPSRSLRRTGRSARARDLRWQHSLTESVDATRALLLRAAHAEGLRTLMVTSALQGEGKTLLSSHLATSLARAGLKVVLVDGDLRRPSLHRLFGLELGPGLSDVLRGQADLEAVARPGSLAGLTVIPAGEWDYAAVRGLGQHRLPSLFEKLRAQYDFVIVDSAPVLPVADSLAIGQLVDGVVFSVLRDVSRLQPVYDAYERLAMLGVNVLGAVVAGAALDCYGTSTLYYSRPPASA